MEAKNHQFKHSGKSVKFDARNPLALNSADDDNQVTEVDALLAQDIESKENPHRRGVRLDFDSDSSDNDGERRDKSTNNDHDDDDIFGSEDEQKDQSESRNEDRKSVKLMDMEAFEKNEGLETDQEHANNLYNDDNGNDEDDLEEITAENTDIDYFVNPDEQERSSRAKRQEPKLEAFNLREDLEEGNFDIDGNFIRNAADSEAHQDQWLTGVSKKDISAAKTAQLQRERRERDATRNGGSQAFVPKSELLSNLTVQLDIGESPLEALQRLNQHRPKKGKKAQRLTEGEIESEKLRKEKVEIITEMTDKLAQDGMNQVYDATREELSREYRRETGENFVDLKRKRSPSPEKHAVHWEFRWEQNGDIHGPYTSAEMASWAHHNYFDERVSVRKVGGTDFIPYSEVSYS